MVSYECGMGNVELLSTEHFLLSTLFYEWFVRLTMEVEAREDEDGSGRG